MMGREDAKKRNGSLFLLVVFVFELKIALARDAYERYRLIQDKTSNDELFRPLGHDFVIDLNGWVTDGFSTAVNELVEASEVSGTTQEKIDKVTAVLSAQNDTEHFVRVKGQFGIPLPSFKFFIPKVAPSLRISFDLGGNYSLSDRSGVFPRNISSDTFTVGNAAVQLYLKQDIKAGLNFDLDIAKNWFGHFYVYGLNRWDRIEYIEASEIVTSNKVIDLKGGTNQQNSVNTDFLLGYSKDSYRIYAAVEELKWSIVSDRIEEKGDLIWGYDPLFKLHNEYIYDFEPLEITPFLGIHLRSGYDLGKGLYGGLDIQAGWFPLTVNMLFDSDYFTFQPRLRIKFLQIEYALKTPWKDQLEGFRNEKIQHFNLRLAF